MIKTSISVLSRARATWLFAFVGALLLSGCGASHYRGDYNGFNAAYADSSNRQMLLNLARMDQHDPSYFMQFGQISVQYQLSATANGTVNNSVPQSTFHIPFLTESGTIGGTATTVPQFTFIPVTDDKVSQQLLLPMPPEDLYTLFQQGKPVDQLLRLMVERFEIQLPGKASTTTYMNEPGRCDNFSYIVFLKICAIARELQQSGVLKLRSEDKYVPLVDDWSVDAQPSAAVVLAAHEKGLMYKKNDDGKWILCDHEVVASFYVDPADAAEFNKLKAQETSYAEGVALDNMRSVLTTEGFSVQGDVVTKTHPGSRLILRSFMGMLAAAAQEQSNFASALCSREELEHVPPRERRPILQIKWPAPHPPLMDPLLSLDYHGQTYQITDPANGGVDESDTWNRDVFTLLTELSGQATVDASKFPLPTSLQALPSP